MTETAKLPVGAIANFRELADRVGGQGLLLNVGGGVTGLDEGTLITVSVDVRWPSAMPSGFFVLADAESLPFRDGCFDGVVAKDVLEHVPNLHACLLEIGRVARSESRMVVLTPRAVPRAVWNDPTHLRGFTRRSLLEVLGATGWDPIGEPRRLGSVPGAGRLRLRLRTIETLLRVPVFGHRFGTNWILVARRRRVAPAVR
jgi:SAM-dependent methyltransferase